MVRGRRGSFNPPENGVSRPGYSKRLDEKFAFEFSLLPTENSLMRRYVSERTLREQRKDFWAAGERLIFLFSALEGVMTRFRFELTDEEKNEIWS